MRTKRSNQGLFWLSVIFIVAVIGFFAINYFYKAIYSPAVNLDKEKAYFHIPSGGNFNQVRDSLYEKHILQDTNNFAWLARQMNLPNNVYPGRYQLKNNMSNKALITLLRSGQDVPVKLTIQSFERPTQLAGYVGDKLEADSNQVIDYLNDTALIRNWGFNQANMMCLFIPNTYEFYWNTTAKAFLKKMHKEYLNFWNAKRQQDADAIDLTPKEVQILASIVQKESSKKDEWDTIAGVYLNRLEKGVALQADPTLKYILKKRGKSVKRIYNKHKELESPYNTYQKTGLPPGPLVSPEIPAIKAVLEPADHDYFYFVAKPNYSGYHNFSETLQQHNRYARRYHEFLNQQNIN